VLVWFVGGKVEVVAEVPLFLTTIIVVDNLVSCAQGRKFGD
jgi:hypothetical protein